MATVKRERPTHLRVVQPPPRPRMGLETRHENDPKRALDPLEGRESEFAEKLSETLAIDASCLVFPPKHRLNAEDRMRAARVRRAWAAYHADVDLAVEKQRHLVWALDQALGACDPGGDFAAMKLDADQAATMRCALVRFHLRHQDLPTADALTESVIAAAVAAWRKRGAPKGKRDDESKSTAWDRINALFVAYGCGKPEGQALRVHLTREGIYLPRKRTRDDTDS